MEEIQEEHLFGSMHPYSAIFLQNLQEALLDDEAALQTVMRSGMIAGLREYLDYMATQDSQTALANVVETLEEKDRRFFRLLHRDEFNDLARRLWKSSLCMQVLDGRVKEKVETVQGEIRWREVWRDLFLGSRLGKMLRKLFLPETHVEVFPKPETAHYLVLEYITQEVDGVHLQAHCTCDKPILAVGEDESDALEVLWAAFQHHYRKFQPCA